MTGTWRLFGPNDAVPCEILPSVLHRPPVRAVSRFPPWAGLRQSIDLSARFERRGSDAATWNRSAVAGFSSMFNLAKRTRPAMSDVSSWIIRAIIRHGPHQGAHMRPAPAVATSTSAEKVASLTVTGLDSIGIGSATAAHGRQA